MDRKAFEHLCNLARLELSADETAEFEHKFERLLEFVDQCQQYEPASREAPLTLKDNVELRKDHSQGFEWPEGTAHEYRVPKIIDFEGEG